MGYCCCCCLCDCCCCRKSENRYRHQFLSLYIILFILILVSFIFRISPLIEYNVIRNKLFEYIKLFSLSSNSTYFENLINIEYENYQYENQINEYRIKNTFSLIYSFCDYNKYLNYDCNKTQYERDNGCNFFNLKKRKCIYKEYKKYCNDENYEQNYCDYFDHMIYNNNYFKCDYYKYNNENESCSMEKSNYFNYYNKEDVRNIPGYIIDYTSSKYLCEHIIYEKVIFFFSFMLLFIAFIVYVIYINLFQIKNSSDNIYYYIILFLLMILYVIFSGISILFCYLFVLTFSSLFDYKNFFIKKYNYYDDKWDHFHELSDYSKISLYENETLYNFLIILHTFSGVISIFSLFLLIPIKNLIRSHINLEHNELNEKYKKSKFYIKDKIFDIEIKIDDELVLKSEEKYYLFKEVKIKEIKKNDNIYILINNEYIKDELSITDLQLYNMNIQIDRLRDLIILVIVILIILIGLIQFFTINMNIFIYYNDEYDKYYNYNIINNNSFYDLSYYPRHYYSDSYKDFYAKIYPTSFQVYKYFEYYIEITEFIICLMMLLIYCFCFIKRLVSGGIKTQYLINVYKSIFKIFIVFNFIYMFLSFFLTTYGFFEFGFIYEELSLPSKIKLLTHSILNFIIMILYIVIIVKNFKLIKYINNIEKEMNLINNENNNPKYIEFIDLYNIKHILKPIIYNNYQINLFYELGGEKLKNKMNKERMDSEIYDLIE